MGQARGRHIKALFVTGARLVFAESLITAYIKEAEHQDGEAYWDDEQKFVVDQVQHLIKDLHIYMKETNPWIKD